MKTAFSEWVCEDLELFLKGLIEFTSETIWTLVFLCGDIYNYSWVSLLVTSLFRLYVFSWAILVIWLSKNLAISYKLSHLYEVIHSICSLNSFNFHRVGNDVPSLIYDFCQFESSFIFLVNLVKYLSILLIFSKKHFLFHWFFSVILFSILLISVAIFIISFFFLALGLV